MAKPGVDDPAPEFTLPGTGGRDYSLSEFRGRPVVVAFYPGDNTPVCTVQLREYAANFDEISGLDAELIAISPQDVPSHEQFSEKQGGFPFPLLADTDREVGRAYGIVGPLGFYRRSLFVIDGAGAIRYAHRTVAGASYRRTPTLVAAIRDAHAASR